jgi:hypothetical protein
VLTTAEGSTTIAATATAAATTTTTTTQRSSRTATTPGLGVELLATSNVATNVWENNQLLHIAVGVGCLLVVVIVVVLAKRKCSAKAGGGGGEGNGGEPLSGGRSGQSPQRHLHRANVPGAGAFDEEAAERVADESFDLAVDDVDASFDVHFREWPEQDHQLVAHALVPSGLHRSAMEERWPQYEAHFETAL